LFLERLNIRGFGCLRTQVEFARDQVNLAVADNETGKSTLIAAILSAFYGIVDDTRVSRDKRPHRRNVLPWDNPDEFGLELDFQSENRLWRIDRDFNSGEVKLIDRVTGKDHRDEYHRGRGIYVIGEELIGLPVDEFLKSFYLKQEEILEIRESKGLTHYIQGVATALEGGTSSELAIQRLRDARDKFPFEGSRDGLKIENAIKRLQTDRESCQGEVEKLERSRREIEPETEKLAHLDGDLERVRIERELALRQADSAKVRELRQLIEAQDAKLKESEALESELKGLTQYESFPAGRTEQLLSLAVRVQDMSASITKIEARVRDEIEAPLTHLETELHTNQDLAGVTEAESRDLETVVTRLADRDERLNSARSRRDALSAEIGGESIDREKFHRMQNVFSGLTYDERRFIEAFRSSYAEEEALYREFKTRREWNEREHSLIAARQHKIINTARLFFLMSAVTIFSGGTLILLTKGEWLGQVLAGLGVVFGAIGAVIRGTSGSTETGALKKLEADLLEVGKGEDESRTKLERIGHALTELATRIGMEGGHELLAEYFLFDEMRDKIEPLLQVDKEVTRAEEEFQTALSQLTPYFSRAGKDLPKGSEAIKTARDLLSRYREVVRLADEFKAVKSKRSELDAELTRLRSDRDSNLHTCEEILHLGGITPVEPLEAAVKEFKEARDKHQRYSDISGEKLPRVRRELLAQVDLAVHSARLQRLQASLEAGGGIVEVDHTEEFYRDLSERKGAEADRLRSERESINRRIGMTYERYQTRYPELQRSIEELDERISQAEAYRSELEMAALIMNDISREVYRSWAAALSEEAAPYLEALNPRYADLQFKEDLSFTVRDRNAARTLSSAEAEAILSTGARDEVFLAARLGVACYLSRGARGAMPIVLDEPLAAVDDDKFLSGMKFFLEQLSHKHQLLIMSCHEERHRWLSDRIPELFEERVHKLILSSNSASW
jgi:DNA repair exonuclease SbcCD ATPase subunit